MVLALVPPAAPFDQPTNHLKEELGIRNPLLDAIQLMIIFKMESLSYRKASWQIRKLKGVALEGANEDVQKRHSPELSEDPPPIEWEVLRVERTTQDAICREAEQQATLAALTPAPDPQLNQVKTKTEVVIIKLSSNLSKMHHNL